MVTLIMINSIWYGVRATEIRDGVLWVNVFTYGWISIQDARIEKIKEVTQQSSKKRNCIENSIPVLLTFGDGYAIINTSEADNTRRTKQ